MSYSVGQYNHVSGISPENFLTALTSGFQATRFPAVVNSGVSSLNEEYPFDEECLAYTGALSGGFEADTTYYLHCRILQLDTNQTFNVKLAHLNGTQEEADETQFLKRIVVQKNSIGEASYDFEKKQVVITPGNNWVDLELVFTPIINFNALVFDLVRSVGNGDYSAETMRYPCIIYNELSIVRNPLEVFYSEGSNVVKLGVQSHPGLSMVINSEPVKIGRTGVYELRSDLLKGVDKFAVVEPMSDAALDKSQLESAREMTAQIMAQRKTPVCYESIQTYNIISVQEYDNLSPYRKLAYNPVYTNDVFYLDTWVNGEDSPSSLCRMDEGKYPKTRQTSSFILDYMYESIKNNE